MKKPTESTVIRSSLFTASRAGRVSKRWSLSGVQGAPAPDVTDDASEDQRQETPDTPSAA